MRFDWDHSYGPLSWKREGREMLRIRASRPQYWKLENLEDFDGERWVERSVPDPFGPEPEADLDEDWGENPQWAGEARGDRARPARRRDRRRRHDAVGRRGRSATWCRRSRPAPGRPTASCPRATPTGSASTRRGRTRSQLAAATSGSRGQQGDALEVLLPLLQPGAPEPGDTRSRPVRALKLEPPPFSVHAPLLARNERRDTTEARRPRAAQLAVPADVAARAAPQARRPQPRTTSRAASTSTSTPASATTSGRRRRRPGVPPLEHFLFDCKAGYCQHFSGAMALLLRFGGVPARVATGFSPGGFRRRQGEWVVRDRDAHSWVEAWFDGIGWVTFDPTPSATPARSLIAAINAPTESAASDSAADAAARQPGDPQPGGRAPRARPARRRAAPPPTSAATGARAVAVRARRARAAARRDRRRWCCGGAAAATGPARRPADRAIADLVTALRRAGRPVPPGVTLTELERRLGGRAPAT